MKSGLTRYALMVGALALGGAAVFSAAAPVTADNGDGVTIATRLGVLQLHLTSLGGTATFVPDSGDDPVTQTITADGTCAVSTTGDNLLSFTAPSPSGNKGPGLNQNGMGVRTTTNCQRFSGQIAASEALKLTLGDYFDENAKITRSELDIEAWSSGNKVTVVHDEGTFTSPALLWNGNGNIKDNTRVVVEAVTRSLTLKAGTASSEVALKGGGDGDLAAYQNAELIDQLGSEVPTADTIFEISSVKTYDFPLGCDEEEVPAELEEGGEEIATSATVTRLPNRDGSECKPIGVTFKITPEGVLLDKSMVSTDGDPQDVQVQVTIEYAVAPAEMPMPPRQINFLGVFGGPEAFEPITWCQEDAGEWIHPDDVRFEIGVIPWCIIDNQETPSGDMIIQTQVYDGLGDPMWR